MDYNIEVKYKRMKNYRMVVKEDRVIVSVPFGTSKDKIDKFIKDCESVISYRIEKYNRIAKINFYDKVRILGDVYQILPSNTISKVTQHYIFLKQDVDIKKQIKKLFKDKLLEHMTSLTKHHMYYMGLTCPLPKIVIQDLSSKWGSYHKQKHEIKYSSNLLFKSFKVYDYLVIHELCHILQFDHSKKFHDLLDKYCPNHKEAEKLLKGWHYEDNIVEQ